MFYTARRSGLRCRKLVYIAATPTSVFGIFCAVLAQPYANLRTLYARPTYTYATVRLLLLYAILGVGTPISYAISTPCLWIRYATIRHRTPAYADPATFHENAAGVRRNTRIISAYRVRGTTQLYAGPVWKGPKRWCRCLCVRLSVPCLTLSRERKGLASWIWAVRKSMTWVTRDPI